MSLYLCIKLVHVLSAMILFGTGIGIAYFQWRSWRHDDDHAFRATTSAVVAADWTFTAPAVLVQLVTGLWLTHQLGISHTSIWFIAVMGLFLLIGACWLPVVWIQIRLRDRLRCGCGKQACKQLMRAWVMLGIAALCMMLTLLYLMVSKLGMQQSMVR